MSVSAVYILYSAGSVRVLAQNRWHTLFWEEFTKVWVGYKEAPRGSAMATWTSWRLGFSFGLCSTRQKILWHLDSKDLLPLPGFIHLSSFHIFLCFIEIALCILFVYRRSPSVFKLSIVYRGYAFIHQIYHFIYVKIKMCHYIYIRIKTYIKTSSYCLLSLCILR